MNRRYVKAVIVLIVAFAIFLPLYYVFSYGKNDGLQETIQQGGSSEGGSWWTAPFSYGANPLETFAVGVLGLAAVFLAMYGTLRLVRRSRERRG